MNRRSLASVAVLVAVGVVLMFAQAPVVGQATSPAAKAPATKARTTKAPTAAKAWTLPRTPDGKPDLQGIWSNGSLTRLERPKGLGTKEFYTDQEFADLERRVREGEVGEEGDLGGEVHKPSLQETIRPDHTEWGFDVSKQGRFAVNKRTSLIVGPEGRIPPMLPEAVKRNADRAAKNKGHEFDSYENRSLQERCIILGQERLPMVPGANDEGNLLQITQAPGRVAMLHETNHHTRVIPTDGRPHIPQSIRQWQGDSVGHWEGDTLVVDTTNFSGQAANFRGSGEKLHLVERFTRVGDEELLYQFTVEDPGTWATPWSAEVLMTKAQGPVYEWACHEGNNMIENILRGARVAEAEAARKATKQ